MGERPLTRLEESRHPYRTAYRLAATPAERESVLNRFDELVRSSRPTSELALEMSAWADTPDKALYLYQKLDEFGDRAKPLLQHLLEHNPHFAGATRVYGTSEALVTYAFEKETGNPTATQMYRPAGVSEADWLAMTDEQRKPLLIAALPQLPKQFAPPTQIAPTSKRPAFLGGLSHETIGMDTWEVAHQSYEFDSKRLFAQMKEVEGQLGVRGFHVHVVSELPENYDHMDQFSTWAKQKNDHIILSAMREGYFPSHFVGVPEAARSEEFAEPTWHRWQLSKHLPSRLSDVNWMRFKNFSMGVRAKIYGKAREPGHQRIGLEFRTVSFDLPTFQSYVDSAAHAVKTRVWEGRPVGAPPKGRTLQLSTEWKSEHWTELREAGIPNETILKLKKLNPEIVIGLHRFEDAVYYDYRTHTYREPDAATKARIRDARRVYLINLRNVQAVADYEIKAGHEWTDEHFKRKVWDAQGYWAEYARVGALYEGV